MKRVRGEWKNLIHIGQETEGSRSTTRLSIGVDERVVAGGVEGNVEEEHIGPERLKLVHEAVRTADAEQDSKAGRGEELEGDGGEGEEGSEGPLGLTAKVELGRREIQFDRRMEKARGGRKHTALRSS